MRTKARVVSIVVLCYLEGWMQNPRSVLVGEGRASGEFSFVFSCFLYCLRSFCSWHVINAEEDGLPRRIPLCTFPRMARYAPCKLRAIGD